MKYEFYKKVKMIRCPGCGFVWFPRVPHPVKCPRCQFFFVVKKKLRTKRSRTRRPIGEHRRIGSRLGRRKRRPAKKILKAA